MKRRILSVCITLVMLMTLFGTTGASAVFAEGSSKVSLSGVEKIGGLEDVDGELRYRTKDASLLDPGQAAVKKAARAASVSDPSFSLVNKMPAIRDQASNDNCWTYGTLASMESGLIMRGLAGTNIDLSENHLTWFTYKGANTSTKSAYAGKDTHILTQSKSPFSEGGNRWFSAATLARWYGAADNSRVGNSTSLSSGLRTVSDIRLRNADFLPEPANNNATAKRVIKNYLVNKGAVDVSYYVPNKNLQKNADGKYGYYYGGKALANHEVAIVGWDDNIYFSGWKGNGAWLVRNSWGSNWGDNGYFYLSYYDSSLCNPTFFEAEPRAYSVGGTSHEYSSAYQYDGVGAGDGEFAMGGKISAANRYTARKDELIKAVGTYTCAANSTVNVSIYINPSSTNPASGVRKVSKSFSVPYAGYHTLDLGTSIGVPKGCTFSIVVSSSFTENGRRYYFLPNETADYDYYIASSIDFSKGQSFINDGDGWYDVTNVAPLSDGRDRYELGNALAKAFAAGTGSAPQTISAKSKYTKTYGNKAFKLNAKRKKGNGQLYYRSGNTGVVKVSSSGKVTIKGPGKTTVTISAAPSATYKSASKKVTITVKPKKSTITSTKSRKYRTLSVKWKKDSKASGYQVVVAQNKSFKKGKKTANIKKKSTTSTTFKKLASGKTYYVKVRAYKKAGSKKVYGSYSKTRQIKTR
ncbi:lectin like domain-containing protein [Anaerovorax odorimutans]|uniref:Lectin like domain-containing protein n=1 Tax=Anaerovorax odorimutans TaxID=109327 RepID=A0ABT1RL64_9FIRM|nr:lectin like domain-containing protein [Anaerovorax odorimutans]MCQ4635930.1 lectin like domain-containing protein [Anaerovorax odorimutans]